MLLELIISLLLYSYSSFKNLTKKICSLFTFLLSNSDIMSFVDFKLSFPPSL